jgi:inosose dehydratase
MTIRVANGPLSYGVFELTVRDFPNLPGPDDVLAEMASAGYEGSDLGPPGYLGEGEALRERIERHGLGLAGGWIPIRFSQSEAWPDDLAQMGRILDLFAAADGSEARPVLADGGSPARIANPGRGAENRALGLDKSGWERLAEGVKRAEQLARSRGFEPTFHPHVSTFVEAPWEIERLLELTEIGMTLDTGHVLLGGGDPVQAMRDWGERINYVHVKDVRMNVLRGAIDARADMIEAWRRGIFCELGEGDVDLMGFFDELARAGYSGWLVVEQDRIPRPDEVLSESAGAQVRNRRWLAEHAGL